MGHAGQYPQSFPCATVASGRIRTKLGEFPNIFSPWKAGMLSKCANPGCSARFLYLNRGKLFRIPRHAAGASEENLANDKKPTRRLEYFWLCSECAGEMTLAFRKGVGIVPVPNRGLALPTLFLRHDSA